MIAQLRGEVLDKNSDRVVIDVNGVGYEVLVSAIDLETITQGEDVRVFTYFHVRENAQELFGFSSPGAKELFVKLISVNGVGPKGAMAIMSLGDEKQIKSAIAGSNLAFITSASGIGKKAAEKIVIDLKDKVDVIAGVDVSAAAGAKDDEAFEALMALGYSAQNASAALSKTDPSAGTQARVKQALKELS